MNVSLTRFVFFFRCVIIFHTLMTRWHNSIVLSLMKHSLAQMSAVKLERKLKLRWSRRKCSWRTRLYGWQMVNGAKETQKAKLLRRKLKHDILVIDKIRRCDRRRIDDDKNTLTNTNIYTSSQQLERIVIIWIRQTNQNNSQNAFEFQNCSQFFWLSSFTFGIFSIL